MESKKLYVLGNCLRGYFEGRFTDMNNAWEILSQRFLISYPSVTGREVQMAVRETNPYGHEQLLICKDEKTPVTPLHSDDEVRECTKRSHWTI